MNKITKTIWDFDNVLFESEVLAIRIADDYGYQLVTKYNTSAEIAKGIPLERGYIYKEYPGTATNKIVEALIKKFSLPIQAIKEDYNLGNIPNSQVAGALADIITEETIADFKKKGLKAIPGITETLKLIDDKKGIENRAGCTTSPEDRMNVSLECAVAPETNNNAELAQLFNERAFSGYDYDNKYVHFFSNIHPDWDPAECAIIEDSKSGVTKARAADDAVRVIGTVAANYYKDKRAQAAILKQAGADIVVSNVRDIPAAIEWLESGQTLDDTPDFNGPVWHTSPDVPQNENLSTKRPTLHQ